MCILDVGGKPHSVSSTTLTPPPGASPQTELRVRPRRSGGCGGPGPRRGERAGDRGARWPFEAALLTVEGERRRRTPLCGPCGPPCTPTGSGARTQAGATAAPATRRPPPRARRRRPQQSLRGRVPRLAPSLSGLRPGRVLHAVSRSLGGRRQVRPAGPGPPARGSWGRLPRGLLAPSSSRHGQLPAGTTGSGGHPDEAT